MLAQYSCGIFIFLFILYRIQYKILHIRVYSIKFCIQKVIENKFFACVLVCVCLCENATRILG